MRVLSTSKKAAADGSGTGGGAATSAAAAEAAPALAAQFRPGTMRPRITFHICPDYRRGTWPAGAVTARRRARPGRWQ